MLLLLIRDKEGKQTPHLTLITEVCPQRMLCESREDLLDCCCAES